MGSWKGGASAKRGSDWCSFSFGQLGFWECGVRPYGALNGWGFDFDRMVCWFVQWASTSAGMASTSGVSSCVRVALRFDLFRSLVLGTDSWIGVLEVGIGW